MERTIGTSSWNFWGLFRYAIDGITSFSVSPLKFIFVLGVIMFIISGIGMLYIAIKAIVTGEIGSGYATTVCVELLIGGIIELSIGIIGEYLGRVFIETKRRPIYIAKVKNIEKAEK